MKTLLSITAALLLTLGTACKSSSDDVDIPCRCGTPMADLEGCAHPQCIAGKTNPDNPQCVCGQIEIPQSKKKE
jgi:hypothetical protein